MRTTDAVLAVLLVSVSMAWAADCPVPVHACVYCKAEGRLVCPQPPIVKDPISTQPGGAGPKIHPNFEMSRQSIKSLNSIQEQK